MRSSWVCKSAPASGMCSNFLAGLVLIVAMVAFAPLARAGSTAPADPDLAIFSPYAETQTFAIDYANMSEFLDSAVVNFGPSERMTPHQLGGMTGTRIRAGHYGPAALEGNRVAFALFSKQNDVGASHLRNYLEKLSLVLDFGKMTRKQQLAYWLNLHNIALIEQIAQRYPVAFPNKIKIGPQKVPLQDAKIVHVKGVALSLRDIREKIVYPQWHNPLVFYGFFRGVVGGPGIRASAFTAQNTAFLLNASAEEFVNSLRGVSSGNHAVLISPLFREMQQAFGMNDAQLREHLLRYADQPVARLLDQKVPLKNGHHYNRIADLSGGERPSVVASLVRSTEPGIDGVTNVGQISSSSPLFYTPGQLPPHATRLIVALHEKFYRLRRRGYTPRVTVGADRFLTPEEIQKADEEVAGQTADKTGDKTGSENQEPPEN